MVSEATVETVLGASIKQLCGTTLQICCDECGKPSTDYPLNLLCLTYDPKRSLRSITEKLRCRTCRREPSSLVLKQNASVAKAGSDVWVLNLYQQ